MTKAELRMRIASLEGELARWKTQFDECAEELTATEQELADADAKNDWLVAERDNWKKKYEDLVAAIVKAMQEQHPLPPPSSKPIVGAGINGHSSQVLAMAKTNVFDIVPFKHCRIEVGFDESPQTILSYCNAFLDKGVMPLVNVTGQMGKTEQESFDKVAALAPVLKGKCSAIEWGNEDWLGGGWNVTTYAHGAFGAARAGAAAGVKVLVQAGGAYAQNLVDGIKVAHPMIGNYAGGWTLHLYWEGPPLPANEDFRAVIANVQSKINGMAHPDIWLTEFGFASANGKGPLQPDNYGHDRSLTLQGAADLLLGTWWPNIKDKVFAAYLFQIVDNAAFATSLQREANFGCATWQGGFWSSPIVAKGAYTEAVRQVIGEGAS